MGWFSKSKNVGGAEDDSTEFAPGIRTRTVPGATKDLYIGDAHACRMEGYSESTAFDVIMGKYPNASQSAVSAAIYEVYK